MTIWRLVKQQLKNRGLILDLTELHRAIKKEWDKITLEEINKAISTMPDPVTAIRERNGLHIRYCTYVVIWWLARTPTIFGTWLGAHFLYLALIYAYCLCP
jgi:hypothetical protein